ncbi:MAG: LysR family transcriptional regulator [Verrucomicrobiaceae bacterium]|nr:LysR family transcriptional regulator [Verrucomicrobiaceae bacterium]
MAVQPRLLKAGPLCSKAFQGGIWKDWHYAGLMKPGKPSVTTATTILPRYRMYRQGEIVLGPGKAELLALVAETGSISEAARCMGMSYNRAWLHIKVMNEGFAEPLVLSSRGGSTGGGALLTPMGEKVVALWKKMELEAEAATKKLRANLVKLLAK